MMNSIPRSRRTALSWLFPAAVILAGLPAAHAQQVAAAPADPSLSKFDANGDGVLDASEQAAQRAAEAKSTAAVTDGEVVLLSPFQVDARKDQGYYASNTLSGTRINSKLEDLGASITVVTKQQLNDTASVDINDIFKFEANTEGSSNYTPFTSASPTGDTLQGGSATSGGPALATRVRGLSAPNIAIGNFPRTARIPIDTYNIDSVEISRGPNSTLFGLGSAAGTVNINPANANVNRSSNEVTARVDSLGGFRTSFNVNRPIVKDRVAIRIAALYNDTEYQQKPSKDLTKRIFGAVTVKPFKNTTINGLFEQIREDAQRPNSLTPRDGVSAWVAAGKPTWNPLTYTATVNGVQTAPIPVGSGTSSETNTLPAGLAPNTTPYTRPSMFIDAGQVQLWEVNRLGTTANPNASTTSNVRLVQSGSDYIRGTVNGGVLYQVPGITDKALYDWTKINAVPTNWNWDRARVYTLEVIHRFTDDLYARVAWHLDDSLEYNRNITSPPVLAIDVNQYLLDGRSNPYFLRPYIQSIEPSIFKLPEYNDIIQGNLVYNLDFEKMGTSGKLPQWSHWFGTHKLQGYYESRHITTGTFRFREAIIDPNHVWMTPGSLNYTNGAAINRATYRYYVGGPNALGYQEGYAPPKSGIAGTYTLKWYNGATGQWVDDPATFGTTEYVSGQTRQEVTSRGFVDQSSFLKDRIVFTGGIRKDFNRTRNSNGAVINGTTGLYDMAPVGTWAPWTSATGLTRTSGIVVKPLPWFGFSYNQSSSFLPQPPAVDLYGTVLPNTYGHGREPGLFVHLFDEKLTITFRKYKNTYQNDRNSNTTLGSRIARIESDIGGAADTFSLQAFANNVAKQRLGSNATQAQLDAEAKKITNWTPGFQSAYTAYNNGTAIRGTNTTEAKGAELEVTYNPIPNWTVKLAGAQTKAINTSLENNLADYIAERMPFWMGVKDDQGNLWWTSTALGNQSAKAFYDSAVVVPLKIDQALLGKSNPQIKEYTLRLTTNYRFTHGVMKPFSVGASVRWDSRSVIGYGAGAADSDGIVRTLDVSKPYYDPARYSCDLWTAYNFKMYKDRIRAHVQLNVMDVFENGGLRATAVNPDGQPYNYRIIDPRKFVLSTTFDF